MRLEFTFNVPQAGLSPNEVARLMADVQHQIVALALLAHVEAGSPTLQRNRLTAPWLEAEDNGEIWRSTYKYMVVESTRAQLRALDIDLSIPWISQRSPLSFEVVVTAPIALARQLIRHARTLYEKFYHLEAEAQRRSLENARI